MDKEKSEITYQNKDVMSKILAENFKNKSLDVYGIHVPKIKQVLPTNLPKIQVNEMRLDNLFLLEDGSVAVIDYESSVKWENYLKYMNYIVRILERYTQRASRIRCPSDCGLRPIRYKKEEMPKQIRMIVIYTADVEQAKDEFSVGCLTLKMEQAFLSGIDSKGVWNRLKKKVEGGMPLSDDEVMELIILPLTYKGAEAKKCAVKETVNLAIKIEDKELQTFVLSGILVFADKIIDASTAKYIKEVVSMTQVAELLLEEGRAEGRAQGRAEGRAEGQSKEKEKVIINLYKSGDELTKIATVTECNVEEVKRVLRGSHLG